MHDAELCGGLQDSFCIDSTLPKGGPGTSPSQGSAVNSAMMGIGTREQENQCVGQPDSGGHLRPSFLIYNGGERNASCASCKEVK